MPTTSLINKMTNPFSLSNLVPNWAKATAILKGDVMGHEFHGNQWIHVAISARKNENTLHGPRLASAVAAGLARHVRENDNNTPAFDKNVLAWREQHQKLAEYHNRRANEMRAKAETAWKQHRNADDEGASSDKHDRAAQAHLDAARAMEDAISGAPGFVSPASLNAAALSRAALEGDVSATSILGRNGAWGKGVVNRAKYGD